MKNQGVSIFVMLIILLQFGFENHTFSQTKEKKQKNPKVEIKVNKQTDENGNITRYDSVYTFKWDGRWDAMPDSLRKKMRGLGLERDAYMDFRDRVSKHFQDVFPRFPEFDTSDFFQFGFPKDFYPEKDSLKPGIYDDLFNDDFFIKDHFKNVEKMMQKHMEMMQKYFEEFKSETDSTRKNYQQQNKRKESSKVVRKMKV